MAIIVVLASTSHHAIAAITSSKVTKFHEILQLQSSAATRVYTDPDIEIAKTIAARFETTARPEGTMTAQHRGIHVIPKLSERNRRTIAALQQEDAKNIADLTFTCEASLTTFTNGRTWYYIACPKCNKIIHPQEQVYVCTKHEEQEPKYTSYHR